MIISFDLALLEKHSRSFLLYYASKFIPEKKNGVITESMKTHSLISCENQLTKFTLQLCLIKST